MDFIHLDIVFPFKHFALHCTKVKVGSKDEASYEFSQDLAVGRLYSHNTTHVLLIDVFRAKMHSLVTLVVSKQGENEDNINIPSMPPCLVSCRNITNLFSYQRLLLCAQHDYKYNLDINSLSLGCSLACTPTVRGKKNKVQMNDKGPFNSDINFLKDVLCVSLIYCMWGYFIC